MFQLGESLGIARVLGGVGVAVGRSGRRLGPRPGVRGWGQVSKVDSPGSAAGVGGPRSAGRGRRLGRVGGSGSAARGRPLVAVALAPEFGFEPPDLGLLLVIGDLSLDCLVVVNGHFGVASGLPGR